MRAITKELDSTNGILLLLPVLLFVFLLLLLIGRKSRDRGSPGRTAGHELPKMPETSEAASGDEQVIAIAPAFQGYISPANLLGPTGTLIVWVDVEAIRNRESCLFRLGSQDFHFTLFFTDGRIVAQRCNDEVSIAPDLHTGGDSRIVSLIWSPVSLRLGCGTSVENETIWSIQTSNTFPPISLIRYARHLHLLPSTSFTSAETLRASVYEALANLQEDIQKIGSIEAFWDQPSARGKKSTPRPKREPDIHPTLHLKLADWALLRSIEVIPENVTGIGNLDFSFTGFVEGSGPESVCVEVKLAHATDLLHGLKVQLPAYMERKRSRYGAYVVLWFRGDWFPRPTPAAIRRVERDCGVASDSDAEGETRRLAFALRRLALAEPRLNGIRVFVLDVSKPVTASKA